MSGDRPTDGQPCPRLLPLVSGDNVEADDEKHLCQVRLLDYLQLVDETGRAVRSDKRAAIAGNAAHILTRLGIDQQTWLRHMAPRKVRMPSAIGPLVRLKQFAEVAGQRQVFL